MTLPVLIEPMKDAAAAFAVLRDSRPDAEAHEVVAAVIDALLSPRVLETAALVIEEALASAWTAYHERPDLYEDPGNSRIGARIVLQAMRAVWTRGTMSESSPTLTADEVAAALNGIEYPDTAFHAVTLPDGTVAVSAIAERRNSRKPEGAFTTRRVVPLIGDDVGRTAFAAVLAIQEHEVGEFFQRDGKSVFDPHDWPSSEAFVFAPMRGEAPT